MSSDPTTESVNDLWDRIRAAAGQTFHTKTGRPFTYLMTSSGVALQNTNRILPRTHVAIALQRSPVAGPAAFQDLQGPSYLWAILNDPRITGVPDSLSDGRMMAPSTDLNAPPTPKLRAARGSDLLKPGHSVSRDELAQRGFTPSELHFRHSAADSCEWDTIGAVPDSPGLYLFSLTDDVSQPMVRVLYVGLTSHLWMVTKGTLPGGMSRPGQRYGRPRWAGPTRVRVNRNIAAARAAEVTVEHWLAPVADARSLRAQEEGLIREWELRLCGWNRG